MVLEHPLLEESRTDAALFAGPEITAQAEALRRAFMQGAPAEEINALLSRDDYDDPFDPSSGKRWLVSLAPVITDKSGSNPAYDTGLVILVQEPYAAAVAPVSDLRQDLLNLGFWAVGGVVVVVIGVWLFTVLVYNDSSRSRLTVILRRQAGLRSVSSGSNPATSTPSSARVPMAADKK
jgi:hypothetical protein